ncbi:MAG: DegT/DnrJ/EryC1/StrS family aminotransferase, partial [Candidatus Omnitrophica bacterium]|nr:DegT/DnrJ/EryC1/StrS family aminotransferase [Candidatus Omnitrophota bacterium]
MIRKLPVVSSVFGWGDIADALRGQGDPEVRAEFSSQLAEFLHAPAVYLTSSGIAALFVVLKTLSTQSGRREVILPAYTAGSLVIAVRKAGLIPVLCDITLDDFNLDSSCLFNLVCDRTLAVIGVHMFGVAMNSTPALANGLPADVFFVEDCAQAMGSTIQGKPVGSFGHISFFSFNRGKNLPLYAGGCVTVGDERLARRIGSVCREHVRRAGRYSWLSVFLKACAFSLATHPAVYGMGYTLISRFKQRKPAEDFSVREMTSFQAALGSLLMKRVREMDIQRHENGEYLLRCLSGEKDIVLARPLPKSTTVFNRFPVLFKDAQRIESVHKRLWAAGIESSRMYEVPL